MFPTFSSLLSYLFGIHVNLPFQTLGFFVVLSFVVTYIVFTEEFKRKEALGLIHAFKRKTIIGRPSSIAELSINTALGFILGFKVVAIALNYSLFLSDPQNFILSIQGNLLGGLILGAGWGYWAYIDRKKSQLPVPKVIEETVHPYQLMAKITFWAAFWGFMGAKIFDTIEHLNYFLANPIHALFSPNGFTYYGGFIFGALSYLYIGWRRGMKLLVLADIGAPGMMLAYAVGRIGCQLSGDGDWGIVNMYAKPNWLHWLPNWMWSFKFPHNVINQGVYINGCQGDFCTILPQGVYPTSFYELIMGMLIFIFLWLIRKRLKTAGVMFFLYLVLNGYERFLIEKIRVTIKYDVLGFMLTQAQIIGIIMVMGGLAGLVAVNYKKIMFNKLAY